MKLHHIFICGIAVFAFSCTSNTKPDEGTVKGQVYTSQEIGWTIQIPKGWAMISNDSLKQFTKRGGNMLKNQGQATNEDGGKYLVSFRKDKVNSFMSTSQPAPYDTVQYKEYVKKIHALIYDTYTSHGMSVDTTSEITSVDGMRFNTLNISFNSSKGGIYQQEIFFNKLINGYDVTVVVLYNNDTCKTAMLNAFMNSKFERKK